MPRNKKKKNQKLNMLNSWITNNVLQLFLFDDFFFENWIEHEIFTEGVTLIKK
jgi:hypothetical protein